MCIRHLGPAPSTFPDLRQLRRFLGKWEIRAETYSRPWMAAKSQFCFLNNLSIHNSDEGKHGFTSLQVLLCCIILIYTSILKIEPCSVISRKLSVIDYLQHSILYLTRQGGRQKAFLCRCLNVMGETLQTFLHLLSALSSAAPNTEGFCTAISTHGTEAWTPSASTPSSLCLGVRCCISTSGNQQALL